MATIAYTYVTTCSGGGHVTLDVSFGGGPSQRGVFEIDDLRAPLSEIPDNIRKQFAELALRIHVAGKTRAQIASEFASPVTITI